MHRAPPRPGSPPALSASRHALITVWAVVNLVNLLQAAGFATRVIDPAINRTLGAVIMALGVPAFLALISFLHSGSGWRFYAGPVVFLAFVLTSLVVDHLIDLEFRSPRRAEILAPYLVMFFGSIVLMGAPMFLVNRRLWSVTVTSTFLLVAAMGFAMVRGVA